MVEINRLEAIRSSFRASDGLELAYRVDDFADPWVEPEPVVILHAAMSSAARFYRWIPLLSRQYRVARLDLRGHGRSALPPADEALELQRLVDDVREFMSHLGWTCAHFVGASAGGYLCQRLALDSPDRVVSLAVFSSTPGLKHSQARNWVPMIRERGLRSFLADTIEDRLPVDQAGPDFVNWFIEQAASNDPEYVIKFVSLMTEQDWGHEMKNIQCPTLVGIPGSGKISDDKAYEPMKKDIPDVTVITYEDAPHNVVDLDPERCANDVLEFLRGSSVRDAWSRGSQSISPVAGQ